MADDREVEGVRILGAQEAQEKARTSGSRTSGTVTKTSRESVVTATTEQTSNIELPHWSEAPTGEVPQTVVEAAEPGDGWEALTGSQPRIRVDQNDWKEVDYDPALNLKDESLSVGALGNDHISLNDNDEEFERNVAEKRAMSIEPQEEQGQRIAKISTVPDTATTEPVVGSATAGAGEPGGRSKASTSPNAKAKREKRPGSAPYSGQGDANATQIIQNEAATLITRTLTGAALAAAGIICFILGVIPTLVFAALLIAAMSFELSGALRHMGAKPAIPLVAVMSFFSVVAGYLVGDRAAAISAFTFFAFGALWYLFAVQKGRPIVGLGMSALVYVYVGVFGSFAGMILGLENSAGESVGVFLLASTVICVAVNDTAAYLVGKFIGRTHLAPAISPNKTFEGTTAGIVCAFLAGSFISISSADNVLGGFKGGMMLGILVACAATFGDLVESMLKRDAKVKDFGTLLPGHGGLMDRFDGLLFALPVAYYFALVLI